MKQFLTQTETDSLTSTNALLLDGYLKPKSVYYRISIDTPEVFDSLVKYPKEMCSRYPQYFDVFNAVLEEHDWLLWEMIKK